MSAGNEHGEVPGAVELSELPRNDSGANDDAVGPISADELGKALEEAKNTGLPSANSDCLDEKEAVDTDPTSPLMSRELSPAGKDRIPAPVAPSPAPEALLPPPPAPVIPERRVLTKAMAHHATGFAFTLVKRWRILTVIFLVQISMNWNAAIYGNAISGVKKNFRAGKYGDEEGGALFLIFYAFGCELWAPFSEEFGRKGVLQTSLCLVNLCQIPCALAAHCDGNTHWLIGVFRALGGLSSAGGSITLGMVADMWEPEEHQYALAFVVLSSIAGSAVAPVFGGLLEAKTSLEWIFWSSLILGAVTQALHYWVIPETRLSCLLDTEAQKLRLGKGGRGGKDAMDIWGPGEIRGSPWSRFKKNPKEITMEMLVLMWRPYKMLFTERIVFCLSALSGFSDMLVFVGLSSYGMVLGRFGLSTVYIGASFVALLIAYLIAYGIYMIVYHQQRKQIRSAPEAFTPEQRLSALTILTWGMPLGLLGFAFTTLGPAWSVHWIAPIIFLVLIGIANYAIYGATIDYTVAAYGEYAASATGGNGFMRDFLAGTAMFWAKPFYQFAENKAPEEWEFVWPTVTLAGVSAFLCIPVVLFFLNGEKIRQKSKMARQAIEKAEVSDSRQSSQGDDAV